ncbi:hypothetical protein [Streptomyces sp. NPDC050504]|uniref:hypothetical protein n=1 Tax=Streptomyces sp. NPDC050504 TaxID=3365618 RepID=UPI0037B32A3A
MIANRKMRLIAAASVLAVAGISGCGPEGEGKSASGKAAESAAPTERPEKPSPPAEPFAGLSAEQIAERAFQATKNLSSLRASGSGLMEGKKMTFDFAFNNKGACTGKLTQAGMGQAEVRISSTKRTYIKGDEQFYRSTMGKEANPEELDLLLTMFKGRWMKVEKKDAQELGSLCDMEDLFDEMDVDRTKGLVKGAPAQVGGKRAVTLVRKSGAKSITYYVAAEGKPYFLQVTKKASSEGPDHFVFGEFDRPVVVPDPPADNVLDTSEFTDAG